METNLNNTSFLIILVSFIILIGCFYFIYQKIKRMSETIGQLQKHLMYQQQLIEKHNNILRNSGTNMNEVPQNPPPSFEKLTKEEEVSRPPVEEKQNPIQTLLPMISSLMGMMNQEEEELPEEENETEEKKTEMVKEIENELEELKKIDSENSLPPEGRVEEEEP